MLHNIRVWFNDILAVIAGTSDVIVGTSNMIAGTSVVIVGKPQLIKKYKFYNSEW